MTSTVRVHVALPLDVPSLCAEAYFCRSVEIGQTTSRGLVRLRSSSRATPLIVTAEQSVEVQFGSPLFC